jgi:nicotinamidase/pyrazinamidase
MDPLILKFTQNEKVSMMAIFTSRRTALLILVSLLALNLSGSKGYAGNAQGWAALVVDVQACFLAGGSLAVPGADPAYVEEVSKATKYFKRQGFILFASRDYHPPNHISFASSHPGSVPFTTIQLPDGRIQKLWPDHCVYTIGDARLQLDNNLFFEVIKKGQNPQYDSYSAFRDDGGAATEIDAILKAKHIKNLVVYGLSTEYCVRASVLDALSLGYVVYVYVDLSRGVSPLDAQNAVAEMRSAGAKIIRGFPGAR